MLMKYFIIISVLLFTTSVLFELDCKGHREVISALRWIKSSYLIYSTWIASYLINTLHSSLQISFTDILISDTSCSDLGTASFNPFTQILFCQNVICVS